MKTLRFHEYGEPADVLRLEDVAVPSPGAMQIRIRPPIIVALVLLIPVQLTRPQRRGRDQGSQRAPVA